MKTDNIKIAPKWSKKKDEIWNNVFDELKDTSAVEPVSRRKSLLFYAAASIIIIAVFLPGFAYFYTKKETAGKGMHLSIILPDKTKADLNAESEISYKPLWWYISRNVKLTGEAYFDVKKGSTFNVYSDRYTVSVLGTSFNVFSRAGKFKATCISGKVKVSNKSESVTLLPNMQASYYNDKLMVKDIEDAKESINWKQRKFTFVGVPLKDVLREIERQYDIEVWSDSDLDYLYSGNFTMTENPSDVLKIVGKPFGIELKIK